jgi:hypothetical protein
LIATQSGVAATGSGKKISAANCNDGSPAGSWGYDLQGYTGLTASSGAGYPPFAASGIITFDGAGHFTIAETLSQSGGISQSGGGGTYNVNADCSFSMIIYGEPAFFYHGVFVDGLTGFFIVDTTPGDAVTGSGAFISAPLGVVS